MRIKKTVTTALVVFLLSAVMANAEIISAQDVKALMESEKHLVIIDASKADTYQAGHLEGAVNIEHSSLYRRGGVAGLIRCLGELSEIFGKNGITRDSNVVIYDEGSQLYSSRIYWILKHVGAENVKVLHNDKDTWSKAGLAFVTTPTEIDPVTFIPYPKPGLYASTEHVRDHKDDSNVVLVDVRTPAEFDGTAKNSEGHIAGAININFTDLLTESGAFKDAAELADIASANGITPDKEVIFYCRTSVRGTVSFTAFESILGYDNVKVYDGAYLEWKVSNPVVQ
jgi:thiosulfate/3-mercaptopyruvate sulfurtransferase